MDTGESTFIGALKREEGSSLHCFALAKVVPCVNEFWHVVQFEYAANLSLSNKDITVPTKMKWNQPLGSFLANSISSYVIFQGLSEVALVGKLTNAIQSRK